MMRLGACIGAVGAWLIGMETDNKRKQEVEKQEAEKQEAEKQETEKQDDG